MTLIDWLAYGLLLAVMALATVVYALVERRSRKAWKDLMT